MERRLLKSEVRVEREGTNKKIRGTAAVFYREGDKGTEYDLAGYGMPGVKERIMPGAFKRALGRGQGGNKDRGQDVYAAINHDPSLVFARTKAKTLKLSVDETGLHYEAKPSDTSSGRDALAHVEAGNFGGSSFAFQVAKNGEKWRMDGKTEIREIHKVDAIIDVSPVTTPAYEATSVNARSAAEARASYEQWKKQLQQDFADLQEINDIISESMPRQEEGEAPEPVDGECPDGWEYDEESDSCVMVEDAEGEEEEVDEEEAYARTQHRHIISYEVDEEAGTATVVFELHAADDGEETEPDAEPVDDVDNDDQASRNEVLEQIAEHYHRRARAALAKIKIITD
jgi:HK97 family phage prohead protease